MLLTQLRFERERGDNIPLWWWLWSTVILCQPLWIFHSRSVGPCGELKENGLFGKQTSETFPFSFQSFVMYIKVISSKRYFFSSLTQEAKVKLLKKMYWNCKSYAMYLSLSLGSSHPVDVFASMCKVTYWRRYLDTMRRKYVVVGLHTVWQTWTSVALPKFFDRSFASFSLFSQILTFYKQIYIYFQEVSKNLSF